MQLSEIINSLGEEREHYFNAMTPPIMQTSNFAFNTVTQLREAFANEYGSYLYSRGINPTVDILRKKLAALDQAEDCLVFNSGDAAITACVMANLAAGDHAIVINNPYTWAKKLFAETLPRFGVQTTFIDGTNIEHYQQAIQHNTKLIYLESPNSFTYELQPLSEVATLAKQHHIVTIIDNTYCTPLYQQPISLGIDISIQSASKYISGHSDVVAGVACGSKAMMQKIFDNEYNTMGNCIMPFNAWLLLRGLRTLPIRLKHIIETSAAVVSFLEQHPQVERLLFPTHPSFPQQALALRQMKVAFGLVTFVLKANSLQQVEAFCESLRQIAMAVSWGGHESLIMPKAAFVTHTQFDTSNEQHRMIRLYMGLETADYIIADLERGFAAMQKS